MQYIFTKSGITLVINDKLEIEKQIVYNQMHVYYLKSENLKFLSRDYKTTVIDNMNRKVADIDISGNAII